MEVLEATERVGSFVRYAVADGTDDKELVTVARADTVVEVVIDTMGVDVAHLDMLCVAPPDDDAADDWLEEADDAALTLAESVEYVEIDGFSDGEASPVIEDVCDSSADDEALEVGETEEVLDCELRADELAAGDCDSVRDTRAENEIAAEEEDDLDAEDEVEIFVLRDTVVVALVIEETDGEREETGESDADGVTELDLTGVALVLAERETVGVCDCFTVMVDVIIPEKDVTLEAVANAEFETDGDTDKLGLTLTLTYALPETDPDTVTERVPTIVAEATVEPDEKGEELGTAVGVADAKPEYVEATDKVGELVTVAESRTVTEFVGIDASAEFVDVTETVLVTVRTEPVAEIDVVFDGKPVAEKESVLDEVALTDTVGKVVSEFTALPVVSAEGKDVSEFDDVGVSDDCAESLVNAVELASPERDTHALAVSNDRGDTDTKLVLDEV